MLIQSAPRRLLSASQYSRRRVAQELAPVMVLEDVDIDDLALRFSLSRAKSVVSANQFSP
jgi:hypothetical protein